MNRAKRLKTKGIYFLYRVIQAVGLPALLLYFLYRAARNPGYWHSLANRLGFLPRSLRQTGPGSIWLHAVSVGEVLSCVEFVRRLRAEFPRTRLFVSTSTLAGRATAGEKLSGIADGVFFAPVDCVFAVRRVLRTLRPSILIVAETEIWPSLFREVKRTGAGLVLVNGRLSDRAFPRYFRFRRLFQAVLPAADALDVQTGVMRDRFVSLGAVAESVRVAGNFKYDFDAREAPADSPVRALMDSARSRPRVWIAASTMPPARPGDVDEDDAVIAAFRELAPRYPGLLLILAPRRPERFDVAAKKLDAAGVGYVRRSQLAGETAVPPQVLLLDTIGELSGLFGLADVVFMGGTLADRGGHNILEPALFGKPVIIGPHMANFQSIAEEFRQAGAVVEISGANDLGGAVARLLNDGDAARATGGRALALAEQSRGATARAVELVRALYSRTIPRYRPALPWLPLLWTLAKLWGWGGRRRARRGLAGQKRLPVPVISVGNLTMGGTGKTPCVLWLAAALGHRKPGILTRGYGRVSPEKQLVLPPGADLPVAHSGDEPQLMLRSGLAPVGIGANRFDTGAALLRHFDAGVLLLDDGFQHRQLVRDLDLVLIDAINPFGGGELFPLGRLREPLSALKRAGVVLITRSEFSDLGPAVEHAVRQSNPGAPVVYGFVEPVAWVESRTGREFPAAEPPFSAAAGFCGLGNPLSFRRTVERLGVSPLDWVEFEDHHRYRPHELRRISLGAAGKGARALITTEKDSVNLCELHDDLLAPLPLYVLKIGLRIEPENDLLEALARIG
jgi:3-deoxy-D-manno-octulosonic-acid transferase